LGSFRIFRPLEPCPSRAKLGSFCVFRPRTPPNWVRFAHLTPPNWVRFASFARRGLAQAGPNWVRFAHLTGAPRPWGLAPPGAAGELALFRTFVPQVAASRPPALAMVFAAHLREIGFVLRDRRNVCKRHNSFPYNGLSPVFTPCELALFRRVGPGRGWRLEVAGRRAGVPPQICPPSCHPGLRSGSTIRNGGIGFVLHFTLHTSNFRPPLNWLCLYNRPRSPAAGPLELGLFCTIGPRTPAGLPQIGFVLRICAHRIGFVSYISPSEAAAPSQIGFVSHNPQSVNWLCWTWQPSTVMKKGGLAKFRSSSQQVVPPPPAAAAHL
jgi:hypothetical protein